MEVLGKYKCETENDTNKLANKFSSHVKANTIIYLTGNLGSGKTYFVKSLAKNFDIQNISSSTYSYISTYHGILNLIHCDFYRLDGKSEIVFDEVIENLINPWLLIIEWPINTLSIPCNYCYQIDINRTPNNTRIYKISSLDY